MLVLVYIYILIGCVSFTYGLLPVSLILRSQHQSLLKHQSFSQIPSCSQSDGFPIEMEQELRLMYYLGIGRKGHEAETNELRFEENQKITLTCSTKNKCIGLSKLKLRWEVDKLKIRSDRNTSSENIALTLTLDRDYNGINVVCVGESSEGSKIETNVTLLLENNTRVAKPHEMMSVIDEGSPLETPENDYHCILVDKNSTWTNFNNLSNILIDSLRMDDNGSRVFCANFIHTGKEQKEFTTFERFDMVVKKWRVIVTKVQTDDVSRAMTEKDDSVEHVRVENNLKVEKYERVVKEKEVERDENYKGDNNHTGTKQDENDINDEKVEEVKQDERHKIDYHFEKGKDPFLIMEVAVGGFVLLMVLIIILIVFKFKKKAVELQLMDHVYAEPQYDQMTSQQRAYSTIKVIMRKKKPCLPPRNNPIDAKTDVDHDPGIQVTNSGYVSTENFQIQSDNVQINMNNYTIMH